MAVLTAHQMGSARIGTSRATSVADPNGHCWDVEGLYICDASALPTSTGDFLLSAFLLLVMPGTVFFSPLHAVGMKRKCQSC